MAHSNTHCSPTIPLNQIIIFRSRKRVTLDKVQRALIFGCGFTRPLCFWPLFANNRPSHLNIPKPARYESAWGWAKGVHFRLDERRDVGRIPLLILMCKILRSPSTGCSVRLLFCNLQQRRPLAARSRPSDTDEASL